MFQGKTLSLSWLLIQPQEKRAQKYNLASVVPDPYSGFSIREKTIWKLHPNCPSLNISNPFSVAAKHQRLFSAFESSAKLKDYKQSLGFPPRSTPSLDTTGKATHLAQGKELKDTNERGAKIMGDENSLPLAEWIQTKIILKSHWVILGFFMLKGTHGFLFKRLFTVSISLLGLERPACTRTMQP